ncbi:hypothetical protein MLD52_04475 [Puniceicoccaceae bacterium K14]|nr:hypothetical protein [Puniceicoccaceae bacterium K14]
MTIDIYHDLKNHFRDQSIVEIAEGKGAQGLKLKGKMFAMFYKGDLTVKLKPTTVQTLINKGDGLPHDPGTGKPMKDRILIPADKQRLWIEVSELSLRELS